MMIINITNTPIRSYSGYSVLSNRKSNNGMIANSGSDSVSFTSARRSKKVDSVVQKAFEKLYTVRDGQVGTYLGLTTKGTNVMIRETSLGKKAELYIYKVAKSGKNTYGMYEIFKDAKNGSRICDFDGNKVVSRVVNKLGKYLDTLK